jgi:GTP-binding protein HflX
VPIVEAWNKWDLLDAARAEDLRDQMAKHPDEVIVPLSALTGEGCDTLLEAVSRLLTQGARLHTFVLPASDGQRLAWLHAHGEVVNDDEAGSDERGPLRRLSVRLEPRELGRFARL